jgi:hypothetical protein
VAGKPGMQGRKPRTMPDRYRPGWLMAVDRRFAPAKIAEAQLQALAEALGGVDELTPQQRALCERATWLHIRLQQMEQQYLAGEGLDAPEYTMLVGSLTSVFRLLGIHRRPRLLPRALDYAAQVAAQSSGGAGDP